MPFSFRLPPAASMIRRITPWLTALRQRWLAAVALLAYLAGGIGFPLPVSVPSGETTARVSACGCPAPAREARKCCCCANENEPAAPSCCGKPAAEPRPPAGEVGLVWVAGMGAWRCQGIQPMAGTVVTLLPPATLVWTPAALPPIWLPARSESPCELVLPLLDPPPRSLPG
jgi:hypothetical protein